VGAKSKTAYSYWGKSSESLSKTAVSKEVGEEEIKDANFFCTLQDRGRKNLLQAL